MESFHQRLSPHAMVSDIKELGVEDTPQYDPYEDELQNTETFPILDEEPEITSRWGDQYVNAETLPPRRGQNGQRLSGMSKAKC